MFALVTAQQTYEECASGFTVGLSLSLRMLKAAFSPYKYYLSSRTRIMLMLYGTCTVEPQILGAAVHEIGSGVLSARLIAYVRSWVSGYACTQAVDSYGDFFIIPLFLNGIDLFHPLGRVSRSRLYYRSYWL